jgi:capsular exopolysaccharide synthesis family protein
MTRSMSGSDPTTLLPIVNAVIHCYLQDITEEEPRLKGQRLADLDEILTKASIRVKKKKDLFKQRAEELGTSDAPAVVQKQVNVLTSLGEYRGQHARVAGDLMKAQSKLKTHQAQEKLFLDPAVPESIISEAAEADPVSKQMLQRLDRIREVAEDYERNATNPAGEGTYRKAKDQMASVRKALDVRLGKLREEVTKRYKQKAKSDYDAILAQLQSEVTLAADNERSVREQVETLVKEAEKIGRSSTELEQLRAEIQTEEKTLSQVGEERQKLDVELRAPPRVRLQQEAGLQKKDVKKQILALIAAPVLAFALVCFLVCWFEFRARRIQSTEEVSTGLGMRVVGSVPALSLPRRPISDDEEDMEEHHLLESIDGIRTLLLRDDSVESTRVVMVTSAVSGEGKTTLASHLASSLARAGRKTLLIDSDLRRPAAHQLFELPLQPGLSEVLLSEAHVAEATRSTSVDGLWVMPAGQWDRDVMHALARDGMEEIVRKLKAKYDFIVIDSHPVLPANDALLVGQHADAVLLSLLRDVSQAPRVYAACQRLNTLGIRILGAVVNGIRQEDYSSGYQYAAPAARG